MPILVPRFPRRIHYVQSVSTSMVVKQILQKGRPSPLSTVGGGLPATKMSPDFSWRDGESRMITRSGEYLPRQGEGVVHPCGGFARDGARASKPEWPNLVPIFYGHHDLSTLLLGTVPTKRSELVDTVEPTSS